MPMYWLRLGLNVGCWGEIMCCIRLGVGGGTGVVSLIISAFKSGQTAYSLLESATGWSHRSCRKTPEVRHDGQAYYRDQPQ